MSDFEDAVKNELQKRLNDPVYLQNAILELTNKIIERDNQIQALKPMKDFYETVTKTDSWFEMSEAVKVLGIMGYGRNKVFRLLREQGILRSNNEPFQKYVDKGYFKIIEEVFELPYGETDIYRKTVVSNKGIEHIKKLIQEDMAA